MSVLCTINGGGLWAIKIAQMVRVLAATLDVLGSMSRTCTLETENSSDLSTHAMAHMCASLPITHMHTQYCIMIGRGSGVVSLWFPPLKLPAVPASRMQFGV